MKQAIGEIKDMLKSSRSKATAKVKVEIRIKFLVDSESGLAQVPIVPCGQTGIQGSLGILLASGPNPIETIFTDLAPVDVISHESSIVLHDHTEGITLGIPRMLGHQVDYAVDRVRSPDRSAGTANDLDPVDYRDWVIVNRVIGAAQHQL